MNPTCRKCGGACCKTIRLDLGPDWRKHDIAWLQARGTVGSSGWWTIPARCPHLDWRGRCRIYATRPKTCRDYVVNGTACRATRRAEEGRA